MSSVRRFLSTSDFFGHFSRFFAAAAGPRKRGRPRKSSLEKLGDSLLSFRLLKRRRGRPKKTGLTHPLQLIKVSRRRGRPLKHPWSTRLQPVVRPLRSLSFPYYVVARFYPLQTLLLLLAAGSIVAGHYYTYDLIFKNLPPVSDLATKEPSVTTQIVDRNGALLFRLYQDENRTPVTLDSLPPHLIQATIAIEDKTFFHHHGIAPEGITRAALANLKHESVQGGSTITQQLVKNRLLSSEKSVIRKLKEMILALIVERHFTKEQILEMYLNQVAYGGSTYGIEAAAHRYFDKPASQLNLAESALLAGLPQAPSVYSPFGSQPEAAVARQHEVLRRMVEDGYLTSDEAQAAQQEPLTYRSNRIDIQAPHFVMYVRELLAAQFGEELLNEGGLIVKTTLDLPLQTATQEVVTKEVDRLKRMRVSNGAALVTNPQTGEILSMVGSRNYFDFARDGQVNVVVRPRQPGSSIKPLTYAVALERGLTPSSILLDEPITYHIPGSKPYSPQNYDGDFHGPVTLKEALGSSYNIPAVKTLAGVGVDTVISKGESMGITTWQDRQRFGLSLTLGGGEVKMIELAQVYGAFANGGYSVKPNPILEVTNYKGEVLYQNECALYRRNCLTKRVLDSGVAFLITDILADNTARTPAFGAISALYIPKQQVAVKTGTTNNLRDNWAIGYTTDRLVATWVGNNDNTSMSYIASGVTGASPIWNTVMRSVLDADPPHAFVPPPSVVQVSGCKTARGKCRNCSTKPQWYLVSNQPTSCQALAQPVFEDHDETASGQSDRSRRSRRRTR